MANSVMEALEALCAEKNIERQDLLDRLEKSLEKSYADVLHLDYGAQVTIDPESGKVYVYELVPVGEPDEETGEFTEFDTVDVTPADSSRIAAMQAKVEIKQIVRDAARKKVYEEYRHRIGDMILGTVLQTTHDFDIIKISEDVEAELPHFDVHRFPDELNERPRNERYSHNMRLRAVIIDVRNPDDRSQSVRGERQRKSIVLSRTDPRLVKRLFEQEIPEVHDGIVRVRAVARDPGVRSKVAVSSSIDGPDPVGACVGPKGSRVRAVVAELRGERVDVIQWNDDPERYIANALSPARVSRVVVDVETNRATVIVPDDQLSLAIGKEGQNARLAARLTGYHIDIKNESLARHVLQDIALDIEEDSEIETGGRRCQYTGPTGVRCRNAARPGSRYCGIHEKLAEYDQEYDQEPVSDDRDSLV
ncbi:MAG: transcription termination factor NusA [Atopobiaceae bacterium]|nr:transcription termination factor NusA [Atopobiaceae bacterium]